MLRIESDGDRTDSVVSSQNGDLIREVGPEPSCDPSCCTRGSSCQPLRDRCFSFDGTCIFQQCGPCVIACAAGPVACAACIAIFCTTVLLHRPSIGVFDMLRNDDGSQFVTDSSSSAKQMPPGRLWRAVIVFVVVGCISDSSQAPVTSGAFLGSSHWPWV